MGIAAIRDLWRSVRALASFARVLRSDDSGPLQTFQIEGFIGEIRDDVPRIGEWGLASRPPANAQAVVISLGGDRGRMVAIGVEDRQTRRKNLAEGETYLYGAANDESRVGINSTGGGVVSGVATLVESTGGNVSILAASGQSVILEAAVLNIDAPSVQINGVEFVGHQHTIPPGTDTPGGISGVPQ